MKASGWGPAKGGDQQKVANVPCQDPWEVVYPSSQTAGARTAGKLTSVSRVAAYEHYVNTLKHAPWSVDADDTASRPSGSAKALPWKVNHGAVGDAPGLQKAAPAAAGGDQASRQTGASSSAEPGWLLGPEHPGHQKGLRRDSKHRLDNAAAGTSQDPAVNGGHLPDLGKKPAGAMLLGGNTIAGVAPTPWKVHFSQLEADVQHAAEDPDMLHTTSLQLVLEEAPGMPHSTPDEMKDHLAEGNGWQQDMQPWQVHFSQIEFDCAASPPLAAAFAAPGMLPNHLGRPRSPSPNTGSYSDAAPGMLPNHLGRPRSPSPNTGSYSDATPTQSPGKQVNDGTCTPPPIKLNKGLQLGHSRPASGTPTRYVPALEPAQQGLSPRSSPAPSRPSTAPVTPLAPPMHGNPHGNIHTKTPAASPMTLGTPLPAVISPSAATPPLNPSSPMPSPMSEGTPQLQLTQQYPPAHIPMPSILRAKHEGQAHTGNTGQVPSWVDRTGKTSTSHSLSDPPPDHTTPTLAQLSPSHTPQTFTGNAAACNTAHLPPASVSNLVARLVAIQQAPNTTVGFTPTSAFGAPQANQTTGTTSDGRRLLFDGAHPGQLHTMQPASNSKQAGVVGPIFNAAHGKDKQKLPIDASATPQQVLEDQGLHSLISRLQAMHNQAGSATPTSPQLAATELLRMLSKHTNATPFKPGDVAGTATEHAPDSTQRAANDATNLTSLLSCLANHATPSQAHAQSAETTKPPVPRTNSAHHLHLPTLGAPLNVKPSGLPSLIQLPKQSEPFDPSTIGLDKPFKAATSHKPTVTRPPPGTPAATDPGFPTKPANMDRSLNVPPGDASLGTDVCDLIADLANALACSYDEPPAAGSSQDRTRSHGDSQHHNMQRLIKQLTFMAAGAPLESQQPPGAELSEGSQNDIQSLLEALQDVSMQPAETHPTVEVHEASRIAKRGESFSSRPHNRAHHLAEEEALCEAAVFSGKPDADAARVTPKWNGSSSSTDHSRSRQVSGSQTRSRDLLYSSWGSQEVAALRRSWGSSNGRCNSDVLSAGGFEELSTRLNTMTHMDDTTEYHNGGGSGQFHADRVHSVAHTSPPPSTPAFSSFVTPSTAKASETTIPATAAQAHTNNIQSLIAQLTSIAQRPAVMPAMDSVAEAAATDSGGGTGRPAVMQPQSAGRPGSMQYPSGSQTYPSLSGWAADVSQKTPAGKFTAAAQADLQQLLARLGCRSRPSSAKGNPGPSQPDSLPQVSQLDLIDDTDLSSDSLQQLLQQLNVAAAGAVPQTDSSIDRQDDETQLIAQLTAALRDTHLYGVASLSDAFQESQPEYEPGLLQTSQRCADEDGFQQQSAMLGTETLTPEDCEPGGDDSGIASGGRKDRTSSISLRHMTVGVTSLVGSPSTRHGLSAGVASPRGSPRQEAPKMTCRLQDEEEGTAEATQRGPWHRQYSSTPRRVQYQDEGSTPAAAQRDSWDRQYDNAPHPMQDQDEGAPAAVRRGASNRLFNSVTPETGKDPWDGRYEIFVDTEDRDACDGTEEARQVLQMLKGQNARSKSVTQERQRTAGGVEKGYHGRSANSESGMSSLASPRGHTPRANDSHGTQPNLAMDEHKNRQHSTHAAYHRDDCTAGSHDTACLDADCSVTPQHKVARLSSGRPTPSSRTLVGLARPHVHINKASTRKRERVNRAELIQHASQLRPQRTESGQPNLDHPPEVPAKLLGSVCAVVDKSVEGQMQEDVLKVLQQHGAHVVHGSHLGTGCNTVVCDPAAAGPWLASLKDLVSTAWLIRSTTSGKLQKTVSMSPDIVRHLAMRLRDGSKGKLNNTDGNSARAPVPEAQAAPFSCPVDPTDLQPLTDEDVTPKEPQWLQSSGMRHAFLEQLATATEAKSQHLAPASLLDSISWAVTEPPEAACVDTELPFGEGCTQASFSQVTSFDGATFSQVSNHALQPIPRQDLEEVVYRGPSISLLLPKSGEECGGHSACVLPVKPAGLKCGQLLRFVYDHYQGAVKLSEQLELLQAGCRSPALIKGFQEGFPVPRSRLMGACVAFEGFFRVGRGHQGSTTYLLSLGA